MVTKQLTEYFRRFFDAFLAAADNPKDPVLSARMAVWVSGFFGSGKSHFIKILSYLLENIEAVNPQDGTTKRAAQFFDEHKIKDAMLLADVQRAVQGSSDVILFNIDAKADSKSDRDVILQVFLRVFNEKLGYSGDAPACRRNGTPPGQQGRLRGLQNGIRRQERLDLGCRARCRRFPAR